MIGGCDAPKGTHLSINPTIPLFRLPGILPPLTDSLIHQLINFPALRPGILPPERILSLSGQPVFAEFRLPV